MDPFESSLLESLQFGFMDAHRHSDSTYAPQVLVNNPEKNQYVISDIDSELRRCQAFYFSVAFVTQTGIGLIKSQLSDLADKGVRGKIIISPYLDFNDPLALRELLKLKNVEVRMSPPELQLHAKYYMFEHPHQKVIISGSSNLTANALKCNYEWNIKLTSTENGDLVYKTQEEFNRVWNMSEPLTEAVITAYQKKRKPIMSKAFDGVSEDEGEDEANSGTEILPNSMQQQALSSLRHIREEDKDKALVISATGTGKTYLAAFDVKQFAPQRMLFIVHREQILKKACESFQRIIGFRDGEACVYKSGEDIKNKRYVFATIQTLSREDHLSRFAPEWFDYILIDEVHKAGAESYKKVMNYFTPQFLLGMTATPERTDGQNIYELFDYNVAYEIRLQEALDNNLLCPFLYYGVTDIEVDGELINDSTDFSNLTSSDRVDHILEKINYYGHDGEKVHGLMFCSSKKEAYKLSELLNARGLRTVALTGDDEQDRREEAVNQLESGELDYILTVDIFNEGIDIPCVNQVVMLRNTQSSIIFIQQLGRGLRKHPSKRHVTIIDFIGNYKNNYLIPVALFGDNTMDKDNYRRDVRESLLIRGITTVNFEEVARKRIFESITTTTLESMKNLRDSFVSLQNRLGRVPYLYDYVENNSIEPLTFFKNAQFRDYSDVINKFADEKDHVKLSKVEKNYLEFMTFEIASGKRMHELIILDLLLRNKSRISMDEAVEALEANELNVSFETLRSVERVLDLSFLKKAERDRYGEVPLVSVNNGMYILNQDIWASFLANPQFDKLLKDVIETGLSKRSLYPDIFTIGRKYSRRDVMKLLNFEHDEPPLNVGGYKIDKLTNSCPIFVTYHKSEDINDTIKYEDRFLDETTMIWFSRSGRNLESNDVRAIVNSSSNGLRIELFVIKNDAEGGDFYYLGKLRVVKGSEKVVIQEGSGKEVVHMRFKLETPVEDSLYRYITQE